MALHIRYHLFPQRILLPPRPRHHTRCRIRHHIQIHQYHLHLLFPPRRLRLLLPCPEI